MALQLKMNIFNSGVCFLSIFIYFKYSHVRFFYCLLFSPCNSWNDKNDKDATSHQRRTKTGLSGTLQFFFVTGMLAVVGSRVASLVVLEFCLRAVSGWVTAGQVRNWSHNIKHALYSYALVPSLGVPTPTRDHPSFTGGHEAFLTSKVWRNLNI